MAGENDSLAGLAVAALESRRADDMQRLILKYGGKAFVSPSMREVPIEENREAIDFAYRVITGEINIVIFLTGVGFQQLLLAVERSVDKQRFLNALSDITTIVRGPKPAAAMREVGLTPTVKVPEPNTWRELLTAIDAHVPITNHKVGVQEYGKSNSSLIAGLEARGLRLGDAADEFVPEHETGLAARVVAVPGVHVRAADAHGFDLQHHFAIGQCGVRALLQLQFAGLGVDKCLHEGNSGVQRAV